jgi:hypothetical protein
VAGRVDLRRHPAEPLAVAELAEPLELPGVDEFVSYRRGELLPAELAVGVPGEHDRELSGVGVVPTAPRASLRALGDVPRERDRLGVGSRTFEQLGARLGLPASGAVGVAATAARPLSARLLSTTPPYCARSQ